MSAQRLPYPLLAPKAFEALQGLSMQLAKSSVGKTILDLIYMRVSQINGCAFCLDMHAKDMRRAGESQARMDTLAGWRDSPFFDEREKAVLAWAEAVARIDHAHAPERDYEPLKNHFSDAEIVDMTFAIAAISAWNRMAISMRAQPRS